MNQVYCMIRLNPGNFGNFKTHVYTDLIKFKMLKNDTYLVDEPWNFSIENSISNICVGVCVVHYSVIHAAWTMLSKIIVWFFQQWTLEYIKNWKFRISNIFINHGGCVAIKLRGTMVNSRDFHRGPYSNSNNFLFCKCINLTSYCNHFLDGYGSIVEKGLIKKVFKVGRNPSF